MQKFDNILNQHNNNSDKRNCDSTQNYGEITEELKKTFFENEEKLLKAKDTEIQVLNEKNQSFLIKSLKTQSENDKLKSLLQKVYDDADKILSSGTEQEVKQNIKKLKEEIKRQENAVYEEIKLKQDKEYFQGQSENSSQYDIKISINSMYDLRKKECKIQYFENGDKKKNQIESLNKCAVIGFQGVKNRGKTFLLNLLNEEMFPSAFYESTLGISAKVDIKPNSNKIYMDSEGVQKPAKFNWDQAYKQKNLKRGDDETQFLASMQQQVVQNFFDIKATEQLQQEFLLQSCEIVVVVVGMLSIEDQKLISSIIDRRLPSQIIVVHNYKELKETKYVEQHIKESLMHQFPLARHSPDLKLNIEGQYNKVAYIDRRYSNVTHLIFAHNKSEAGDYYNRFSLEYIRQIIQLSTKQKAFSISEKFLKFLNDYLPNYIEFQNQSKPGDKIVIKEASKNEDIISLVDDLEIKKIKDITLDVFGRIINAINYSIVEYKQENKLFKKVDIELPGNISFEQKNCITTNDEKGRTILAIKATKQADIIPQSYSDVKLNEDKRHYSEFILKIQISNQEQRLTQIGSIVNNQNGVFSLIFKQEPSEINCIDINDQDED